MIALSPANIFIDTMELDPDILDSTALYKILIGSEVPRPIVGRLHRYYWETTQLPATLGYEASGIVTALGANVDPSWLNKRVSTIPAFSLNQYGMQGKEVIVPVHALAEYPSHLTPVEATSIWLQYMTAYGARHRHRRR